MPCSGGITLPPLPFSLKISFDAEISTWTNLCLTRDLIRSGDLWRYFDLAKELNVGMTEMLEPRPCGGYASQGNDILLTDDEKNTVMESFITANTERGYRHYPLIYHVAFTEAPEQTGCMMGGFPIWPSTAGGMSIPACFFR
jgi:hypothetical protein